MSDSVDLNALVSAITARDTLAPVLSVLGFEPVQECVPRLAWTRYGLDGARDLEELWIVGRAGSLTALLLELAPAADVEVVARLARRVQDRNPARLYTFLAASPAYCRLTVGVFGLDGAFHHLNIDPDDMRASDGAALEEMLPGRGEVGLPLLVRQAAALDRSRITGRFFRDFRSRRSAIARAWTGLPEGAEQEREQLALLLLSRLTFLYFLQRRGALAGDDAYLPRLFGQWNGTGGGNEGGSFYRQRLVPLFFGVLNRRPEDRTDTARRLGPLPYLNGGLFERNALELRFDTLDLPDGEVQACFDQLFERYRFTSREFGDGAGHGVDPEVLGRVFEGLMAPHQRLQTGSFYTPAPVVERVVKEAVAAYMTGTCAPEQATALVEGDGEELPAGTRHRVRAALERVRVLDPACGSGAFLLGALHRLATALGAVSDAEPGQIRRTIVARSLHGVDLLDDAALLCALRLWLALAVADDEVRPLPNLDRRIRQGDALVDPLDLGKLPNGAPGTQWHPLRDPDVRQALKAVEPAARRYVSSGPEQRDRARTALDRAERRLASRWLRSARTAEDRNLRWLRVRALDRDLFGEVPESAHRARTAIRDVEERVGELDDLARALDEKGALPFFSFGVHFADAAPGFDLIISNPPWVRSHRWPDRLRRLGRRFEVCRPVRHRTAILSGAPGAGTQVDMALLFLERSIRLLAPGGVLAMLLPAKALRALYGGGARQMVLRDLDLALIEDHALDQRSIFQADAFASVLIARKRSQPETPSEDATPGPGAGPAPGASPQIDAPRSPGRIRVHLTRRGKEPLEFEAVPDQLRLFPNDPASPWVLAPPDVTRVFRDMQTTGPPIGEHADLRVRRGVMTGANDVLLFREVRPKLGGLAEVEAVGYRRERQAGHDREHTERYRAVVETAGIRPLVRGAGIDAFSYRTTGYVAWCHDESGASVTAPPRLQRYLQGHADRLQRRSGWRTGLPLGCLFRIGSHTTQPKVAWHDLSDTVRAVALPATVPWEGAERELVPLNTVYFIPVESPTDAVLLAGLLNSLPVRVLARSFAERAKDARFRFFAWTIAALPLPSRWRQEKASETIRRVSERAHQNGGIDPDAQGELDRAVARLYGLPVEALGPLDQFDRWLRNDRPTTPEPAPGDKRGSP